MGGRGRWQELWDRGIGELTAYLTEHGDVAVPSRYVSPSGYKLGSWVSGTRNTHAKGRLSPERIAQLDGLGFIWRDASKPTRSQQLSRLAAYRQQHGHLDIPILYTDDDGYQLGQLMRKFRTRARHGTLDADTAAALADLGYDSHAVLNRKRFELWITDLTDYRATFGHTLVSPGYVSPTDWALGWWVHHTRGLAAAGTLADERAARLDTLGFVWSLPDPPWPDRIERLARYREVFGHSRIPVRYIDDDGHHLGSTAAAVRRHSRDQKLPAEVRSILQQLEFPLDT